MADDTDTDEAIAELGRRMARAVTDQDFEEAGRLRAEIDRLAGVKPGGSDLRLGRGTPGAMGLGTDQPTVRRRKDWKPPPRPDPMTGTTRPRSR